MSWYALGKVPKAVRDSITQQAWDKSGWACGCMYDRDADGTPLVWFCQYHEGAYDFCGEEC